KLCKACLPAKAFVEWVLVNNDCPFTVCPAKEDFTSPTPNPEPRQPSPLFCTEYAPEPTAAAEPEHATECNITTEPELDDVTGQKDLIDWIGEVPFSPPVSPVSPDSPASPKLPPSFPLPPPLNPASFSVLSLLVPVCPSAHPQSAPSGHSDPLRDFQAQAPPRRKDPGSPPPASKSWTPPQSSDPLTSLWLLAPSSPRWPVIPPAPPGSLVHPAPPWSAINHLPPRDFTPPALPHHSVPSVL
ncbi:hypothetical protein M9458_044690, partial [Cirrhinus mrigala]